MQINLKRLAKLAAALTICFACVAVAVSQQTSPPDSKTLAMIKYDGDMTALLATLTETFNVAIGLELDPGQPKPRVKFEAREATLSDVLNAIVKAQPGYQWRERDGAIEVLPVEGGSTLLDTTINTFQVSEVDEAEAIKQLIDSPEVQNNLRAMSLSNRDAVRASTGKQEKKKFSLYLEDVTMRRALHRIVREGGSLFWVSQTSGNRVGGGFFSINSRSR